VSALADVLIEIVAAIKRLKAERPSLSLTREDHHNQNHNQNQDDDDNQEHNSLKPIVMSEEARHAAAAQRYDDLLAALQDNLAQVTLELQQQTRAQKLTHSRPHSAATATAMAPAPEEGRGDLVSSSTPAAAMAARKQRKKLTLSKRATTLLENVAQNLVMLRSERRNLSDEISHLTPDEREEIVDELRKQKPLRFRTASNQSAVTHASSGPPSPTSSIAAFPPSSSFVSPLKRQGSQHSQRSQTRAIAISVPTPAQSNEMTKASDTARSPPPPSSSSPPVSPPSSPPRTSFLPVLSVPQQPVPDHLNLSPSDITNPTKTGTDSFFFFLSFFLSYFPLFLLLPIILLSYLLLLLLLRLSLLLLLLFSAGFITKLGGSGMFKNWKRRWFVLQADFLYYFKSPETPHAIDRLDVRSTILSESQEYAKPYLFTLTSPFWGRIYFFSVETRAERDSWMRVISL
jgi:hypothetical protein